MTERCPMSDLPVDQCALPCHLNVALPREVDPEIRCGDVPFGIPTSLTPPAATQHEARDTRARATRPKPIGRCRWDGDRWVTLEHTRGCDSNTCRGCRPCGSDHCSLRGTCPNHVDTKTGIRTCPQCIGTTRNHLTGIETLAALVDAELAHVTTVEHAVSGPDAPIWTLRDITTIANLAGPVADPGRDQERGWCDYPPDVDQLQHPATILGRWEAYLRFEYGHPKRPAQDAPWPLPYTTTVGTVSSAVDYLTRLLDGPMPHDDVFEPFAREVSACYTHLETALSDSHAPETGAPCPKCRVEAALSTPAGEKPKRLPELVKSYGHWCEREDCKRQHYSTVTDPKTGEVIRDTSGDKWTCPAGHEFSDAEYRQRIDGEYLANAEVLTADQIGRQYEIAPGTIRRWASKTRGQVGDEWVDVPPKLKSVGRTDRGIRLYKVSEVRALHRGKRATPVDDKSRGA